MFLQFLRGEVENVTSGVSQQGQLCSQVMDQLKSYVPKVQSAWIGGDADAFANDVATVLVPDMMALIAAIGGINVNLNSATNIVDQADQKCNGMAGQLSDTFGGILSGGGGGGGGGFGGIGASIGSSIGSAVGGAIGGAIGGIL